NAPATISTGGSLGADEPEPELGASGGLPEHAAHAASANARATASPRVRGIIGHHYTPFASGLVPRVRRYWQFVSVAIQRVTMSIASGSVSSVASGGIPPVRVLIRWTITEDAGAP